MGKHPAGLLAVQESQHEVVDDVEGIGAVRQISDQISCGRCPGGEYDTRAGKEGGLLSLAIN